MSQLDAIAPHGGELVNRIATESQRLEFLAQAGVLPRVSMDQRTTSDLEMIAIGGFSPLTGFMEQQDYEQVVHHMHLGERVAMVGSNHSISRRRCG